MSDINWVVGILKSVCVDGKQWTEKLNKDKRIPEAKIAAIDYRFSAIENLLDDISKLIYPRRNEES